MTRADRIKDLAKWTRKTGRLPAADRIAGELDRIADERSGMEPRKNPRQPIFRNHDCGGCNNGEKPCREGNYNSCSNPRARND